MAEIVVDLAAVPPGTMKTVDLDGVEVVIANVGGECFAFGGICPHEGGSLGDGELHGTTVTCPWHGARFDIRTGAVIDGYTDEPVRVYDVAVDGDVVRIRTA
ncbi:MAG: Rieske 2Fe-2S domain-containing protein [Bauldia sp.]|nr:Rieske 2Fe-2S domain-containing protein [Bauldia sp.]